MSDLLTPEETTDNTPREKTRFIIADLFNVPADRSAKLTGKNKPGRFTPVRNHAHIFDSNLGLILAWLESDDRDGLYIYGPTQCGKTSSVREVCARLNLDMFETDGHAHMELSDLLGQYVVIDGDMLWQDGILTNAVRADGIFVLNEIDAVDPGVLIGLHKLLEGRDLVITENGGEIVPIGPDFKIVVTGNTNGMSDPSGIYSRTNQLNAATVERFWMIEMDYLDREKEAELLVSNLSVPKKVADRFVSVAEHTRPDANGIGQVEIPLSTHSLLRACRIAQMIGASDGNNSALKRAFRTAYSNRLSLESREAVDQIIDRVFP